MTAGKVKQGLLNMRQGWLSSRPCLIYCLVLLEVATLLTKTGGENRNRAGCHFAGDLELAALPVGAAGEALLVAEETVDGRQPFCTAGIVAVVVGEVADGTCEDDRQNNDDEIGFHVRSSIREFNLL